jgi:hypothetical protein
MALLLGEGNPAGDKAVILNVGGKGVQKGRRLPEIALGG